MKNTRSIAVAGIIALAALSGSALADGGGRHHQAHVVTPRHVQHAFEHRLDRRQDNQQWRIDRGVASGELTRHEARTLQRQQQRIAYLEHRFGSDGYYSPAERRRLERLQNGASRRIHAYRHNGTVHLPDILADARACRGR